MVSREVLQILQAAYERGRRRYPTVGLSFESFSGRIEEILAAGHFQHTAGSRDDGESCTSAGCPDCLSQSRQLHHEDLFLALACVQGDRVAWECFAEEYLELLRRFAMRACRSCDAGEDLAHEIVTSLLGGRAEPVPAGLDCAQPAGNAGVARHAAGSGKLGSFNGRGSLAGWLRAAVSHAAIDRLRRGRKQVSLDELLEQGNLAGLPDGSGTDQMENLDAHWVPVLAGALEAEISRLEPRDRLLITLYYVQGAPLKAIGRQFGVHEATASRWLEKLRNGIRKRVERALLRRHGLSARDLASIWQLACESDLAGLAPVPRSAPADDKNPKKMQGGVS